MKASSISEAKASAFALLEVADYLSRPQQFLAVAEARAGLRRTLREAIKHSIVLTNNGEPQAAIVPFETLEAMRGALLQLLVGEMRNSFERLQQRVATQSTHPAEDEEHPEPVGEDELESLVREARRRSAKAAAPKKRKRRR
jgi:PHD/YefM family antitoxin component YafN of YafNO toxin-antitoxin module